MNDREKIMMDVMAELSLAHAPVAFKGAMLLKIALEEKILRPSLGQREI